MGITIFKKALNDALNYHTTEKHPEKKSKLKSSINNYN